MPGSGGVLAGEALGALGVVVDDGDDAAASGQGDRLDVLLGRPPAADERYADLAGGPAPALCRVEVCHRPSSAVVRTATAGSTAGTPGRRPWSRARPVR